MEKPYGFIWGESEINLSKYNSKALEIVLPDVIINDNTIKILNDFVSSAASDGIEVWYVIAK